MNPNVNQKLETLRSQLEEAWDSSSLGYTKSDLEDMDADERARTLYELLNQAGDLAQNIASAFKDDLAALGTLDKVKMAAADLIRVARKAHP